MRSLGSLFVVALGVTLEVGSTGTARAADPPITPLGVSYSGWKDGFQDAPQRLEKFRAAGFHLVTFVPAYAYVGRNRIDLGSGPSADELGRAVELAVRAGRMAW